MHKLTRYLLITVALFSVAITIPGINLMTPSQAASADLPLHYPLNAVSISLLQQTAHGIAGGYQITLRGDGNNIYSCNGKTQQVPTIDKKALLDLINEFYELHFFELADSYSVKKQLLLNDDNTLATIATKMLDTGSKQLCIQLAEYKKCITIINNQPAVAAQLVKKIEALVGARFC
ncbi:MAG: hypothetical protein ABL885_01645 [Methylophilaceae bacterium]